MYILDSILLRNNQSNLVGDPLCFLQVSSNKVEQKNMDTEKKDEKHTKKHHSEQVKVKGGWSIRH